MAPIGTLLLSMTEAPACQLAPGRIEAYVATDLRSASSSETLGLNKAAVTALLGLVVAPKATGHSKTLAIP